jgi:hypothetical protein
MTRTRANTSNRYSVNGEDPAKVPLLASEFGGTLFRSSISAAFSPERIAMKTPLLQPDQ